MRGKGWEEIMIDMPTSQQYLYCLPSDLILRWIIISSAVTLGNHNIGVIPELWTDTQDMSLQCTFQPPPTHTHTPTASLLPSLPALHTWERETCSVHTKEHRTQSRHLSSRHSQSPQNSSPQPPRRIDREQEASEW